MAHSLLLAACEKGSGVKLRAEFVSNDRKRRMVVTYQAPPPYVERRILG
jgi:hypothetical protein